MHWLKVKKDAIKRKIMFLFLKIKLRSGFIISKLISDKGIEIIYFQ